jgi:hypothetical protein
MRPQWDFNEGADWAVPSLVSMSALYIRTIASRKVMLKINPAVPSAD